jgi:hypothetical protein
MIKAYNQELKISSPSYPFKGLHEMKTVCMLFLGYAQDEYRGLLGLFRLNRIGQWMKTWFS